MPRYRLSVEYDGSGFRGWQRQENALSVQQAMEEAFEQFCGHGVRLFAAGRTDAGVHALGQVVHVDLERDWPPEKIVEAVNAILKLRDMAVCVLECERAAPGFDARFDAVRRHYLYRIVERRAPLALERGRAWRVAIPLDAEAMNQAARLLEGHHDFSTFRARACQAKSPLKTLDALEVRRVGENRIEIEARSRSFLHSQVRSMAGSLKLVGEGKWSRADLRAALDARDRKACGPLAPACGLYLVRVDY